MILLPLLLYIASFPLTTILYGSAYWKVSEYNHFFYYNFQQLNNGF